MITLLIEHKIALLVIFISLLAGLLNGFLFNDQDEIITLNTSNTEPLNLFFQIITHNSLIAGLMLILSIFLYIGPSIPVIATFFLFGSSFATIADKSGIGVAISTYPHLIPEAISIFLFLAVAYMICTNVIAIAFKNKPFKKNLPKIFFNFMVAIIFLIIAAFVETIKLS